MWSAAMASIVRSSTAPARASRGRTAASTSSKCPRTSAAKPANHRSSACWRRRSSGWMANVAARSRAVVSSSARRTRSARSGAGVRRAGARSVMARVHFGSTRSLADGSSRPRVRYAPDPDRLPRRRGRNRPTDQMDAGGGDTWYVSTAVATSRPVSAARASAWPNTSRRPAPHDPSLGDAVLPHQRLEVLRRAGRPSRSGCRPRPPRRSPAPATSPAARRWHRRGPRRRPAAAPVGTSSACGSSRRGPPRSSARGTPG